MESWRCQAVMTCRNGRLPRPVLYSITWNTSDTCNPTRQVMDRATSTPKKQDKTMQPIQLKASLIPQRPFRAHPFHRSAGWKGSPPTGTPPSTSTTARTPPRRRAPPPPSSLARLKPSRFEGVDRHDGAQNGPAQPVEALGPAGAVMPRWSRSREPGACEDCEDPPP